MDLPIAIGSIDLYFLLNVGDGYLARILVEHVWENTLVDTQVIHSIIIHFKPLYGN